MQSKSATYNTILADENHFFEVKLNINGTDYGQDVIYGAKSDCKVFDTAPTIGGTYSGTLEFSLLGDGSAIPKMASVKPYFRAVLGATTSEWIQKGEFFIDTRSVSHNDNGLTVFSAHCFDAMLKANANYATSSLAWPATDTAVVAEIVSKMGVSQDSRNSAILTGGYSIPLPTEYTMRDVLSFIAAMYAANWIITDEGKLRIVPIAGGSDTLAVGKSCANLDISTSRSAYTKVIYEIDDETVVESGSTDTNVMEVYNPFGTQTEADAVYTILSAWSYKPFDASGVWSDPCVEVGDQITAVGESGTIYSRSITFGPGMVMELSAPNDNYVDHEYAYESPEERRYTRTVNGLSSSISLNASGVQIVSQKLDNFGGRNILLNSATLQWSVVNGATVTHTTGQSVTEWLCNDAIRAVGNCGNVNGVCLQMYITSQTSNVYLADTHYIMSCYIKNNHATKSLWLAANNGTSEEIAPGEAKRAVAEVDGDGYTALRMRIYVAQTGDPFDFTYWHPQIECGEVLTAWNPAPEDKVGNNEIISKINVSPEVIVIQASKVDLAGYVTFTNLSTSGQTTVNGANITTGLIQDASGKNSWNLDTGALTITNGTINITTDPGSTDYIRLNWFNNDFSSMRILELYPGDNSLYGYGRIRMGVRGYNPSLPDTYTLTFAEISHNWQGMTYAQEQYVNGSVTSRKTIAQCTANAVSGYWGSLTNAGLSFLYPLDPNIVSANYPASGLYLQDITSKNLLQITETSTTSFGITYTVNADGSVYAKGTSTGYSQILLNGNIPVTNGKQYIVTGLPYAGSTSTYFIRIAQADNTYIDVVTTVDGTTFTAPSNAVRISIVVPSGSNISSGITFRPMMREVFVDDSTFVPWVRTQAEQDQAVANLTLQSFSSKNIDDEQWRQGDWNNTTSSTRVSQVNTSRPFLKGGVSYTVTNSGYASYQWTSAFLATQQATSFIGGTSWTGAQSYTFTPEQDCYIAVIWRNNASTAITPSEIATNCKFMIRETNNTDDTYVPLVKTAEQLTTMRPFEMADCFHQYIQVAGSISFTLKQGVYLVTIGKYSTTDANTNGLYVMTVYNSSSIYAIKSSSAATVSVSGYTVSVTSSQNYVEVSAIKVA